MTITINGQVFNDFSPDSSIFDVLRKLNLPLDKIAVERNLEIVPKSCFDEISVVDGDRLEIIHFIGGG